MKKRGLGIRISLVSYDEEGAPQEQKVHEEKLKEDKPKVDARIVNEAVNRSGRKE